jgi:predicted nucleic acid-binding protein
MRIIDANVVIQYLAADHPSHSVRTIPYFDRLVSGEERALMIEGVIVEIIQVLSSRRGYAMPRLYIADALQTIISLPGLHVPDREQHFSALSWYASSNLDYVDCLNVAFMRALGITEIVTFDHDYDFIPGIARVEP